MLSAQQTTDQTGLKEDWAVSTKLEPARSKGKEILEINVLQKLSPYALYTANNW